MWGALVAQFIEHTPHIQREESSAVTMGSIPACAPLLHVFPPFPACLKLSYQINANKLKTILQKQEY